jgi:hypothetical protein
LRGGAHEKSADYAAYQRAQNWNGNYRLSDHSSGNRAAHCSARLQGELAELI